MLVERPVKSPDTSNIREVESFHHVNPIQEIKT